MGWRGHSWPQSSGDFLQGNRKAKYSLKKKKKKKAVNISGHVNIAPKLLEIDDSVTAP